MAAPAWPVLSGRSGRCDGSLVAALVAEQKSADHGGALLRFVQRDNAETDELLAPNALQLSSGSPRLASAFGRKHQRRRICWTPTWALASAARCIGRVLHIMWPRPVVHDCCFAQTKRSSRAAQFRR